MSTWGQSTPERGNRGVQKRGQSAAGLTGTARSSGQNRGTRGVRSEGGPGGERRRRGVVSHARGPKTQAQDDGS